MQGEQVDFVQIGRQRFIERPRLTRLLDQSEARVLMLIAPAGYGKTTLARQWLGKRSHGWYRGGSGSADVAALAIGLSAASQTIVPGAGERMQERLRATGTPEEDVVVLAEMLAEDLQDWPEDAWLAFDDYQFACRSRFSERFVDLLLSRAPVRFLLTSRLRPSWATSRRLLYGEVHEIGRTFLAMTDEEAIDVLGERERTHVAGLVALAEGWPAVIGLASLTEGRTLPEASLPSTLYDYFAEELYQAAPPELQWQLCQLALVPSFTTDLAEAVLGAPANKAIADGARLGFFTSPAKDVFDTHRLLRTFLESKFREAPESETEPITLKLGRALADRGRWDDAFDVVERFFSEPLFLELMELALPSVLRDGRLPTLDRWVEFGLAQGIDAAVLNLAEAESSFRRGERDRAATLALQAARRMGDEHPLTVRAFLVAGLSAQLSDRNAEARGHYSHARSLATTPEDRWDAIRGEIVAASKLEDIDTEDLLETLDEMNDGRAEREIALATVRFSTGTRLDIRPAYPDELEAQAYLAERLTNPIIRTAFLYVLAQALVYAGRYRDALRRAAECATVAKAHRLPFVKPYLSLVRAQGEFGLRNFGRTVRLLDAVDRMTKISVDSWVRTGSLLVRAHVYLAEGLPEQALEVMDAIPAHSPPSGEFGEYLLAKALASASLGEPESAHALAVEARNSTRALHVRALGTCLAAILALQAGESSADEAAHKAYETIRATGDINAFVCAYRCYPDLLTPALSDEITRRWLTEVLRNARDEQIATRLGLEAHRRSAAANDPLSPREKEVLDLLVQGLTNRQIARVLWISDGTVKVHLRHIFDKLGVRTRVEAAMKAATLKDIL